MAIAEVQAKGLEYLALATELLQRARLADEEAGLWEAADLQWWWRTPRRSDAIDQLFWIDDEGPVAGVVLTDWGSAWGCDLIVVPGVTTVPLSTLWGRAVEAIDALALEAVDVLVDNDDAELVSLLAGSGFVAGDEGGTTWMDAEHRPGVTALPEGFVLVDRALETTGPHPMRNRNGEQVEARLRQCSLYDPALDLAVETADGQVAGYALYWFDSRDRGWDAGADESRGRVPAARPGPCHVDRRSRTAGIARGTAAQGQLRDRRGAFALRRRGVPGDLHEHVV